MTTRGPPVTRVEQFTLKGYRGEPTRGTVSIREFGRDQRVSRALAGLGKWWGVALGCVFIPIAHFVLVPSFLDARGTCPDCGTEQALDLAPRWRAPQPVTCKECRRGLRLSLP